jgi:rhamnosyltransferase
LTNFKIAAVTVLYHPDKSLIENIQSYLYGVDLLFLVDNTESSFSELPEKLSSDPKIIYIKNPSNLGIAEALNIAASAAIERSFDFLLTMDQDSSFRPYEFKNFTKKLDNIDTETVAIISPLHVNQGMLVKKNLNEMEKALFVMTSGNILNLKIYKKAGPFDHSLFIDHVDHEYCLRLRSHGYIVLVMNNIFLNHPLGEIKKVKILNITILQFISHTPIRTYYMIRNGLSVAKKYKNSFPAFAKKNLSLIAKELIKIPFEKDKKKRLHLALLAIRHYRNSKMGKFDC